VPQYRPTACQDQKVKVRVVFSLSRYLHCRSASSICEWNITDSQYI